MTLLIVFLIAYLFTKIQHIIKTFLIYLFFVMRIKGLKFIKIFMKKEDLRDIKYG